MMRKFTLGCIFSILILMMGCLLQSPESNPSFSILPEVIIDYDFDAEEIKIWVKSALSDYKYDNITIAISKDPYHQIVVKNYTYCETISTEMKVFNLKIIAASEDRIFEFNCDVDVDLLREDLIIITTYDIITNEPTEERLLEDNLPFKKILKERKEED